MSDKAMLLRDADEAFGELHRAIDGLTDEETGRVWLGTWGVREILIHISGWHDAMASALDNVTKGEPAYAAGMYDDYDAWNARFVEQRAGVKIADVIAELDWSVGEILDAVQRSGLDEQTLVIFTSDNGPWLLYGDHAGSADPFREGKGTAFEGGVREPFIARWPGRHPFTRAPTSMTSPAHSSPSTLEAPGGGG